MSSYRRKITTILDRIDEKYSSERIARAKRKWTDLWDFNQPFELPPIILHRGRDIDGAQHPAMSTLAERRQLLETKLNDILTLSDIDDDYIPVLHLDAGAYILAEVFGGRRIHENNLYMISPFLMTPDDIANLSPFDPGQTHQFAEMVFETLQFFYEETQGRIAVNIHTPQGPMETLSCLCDSSCFYLAMLDSPAMIVGALGKVLDAYIWYIRRQQAILGDKAQYNFAMSYTHRPVGTGIGVGEDIIATIGPDCFGHTLPVYRRIASEFGPILLHSCGNPEQQVPLIMQTEVISGIHFSQIEAKDFMPQLTRPVVVQSRNDWKSYDQLKEYVQTARQCRQRVAYQFQSLAQSMQINADRTQYDVKQMSGMFTKVREIICG